MLIIFFVTGILNKLCATEASCLATVGFESAYYASLVMLCAGIVILLVPFCMFVWLILAARNMPILHIRGESPLRTMEPAVVSLTEGERFHLFLSHIWSTGQGTRRHQRHTIRDPPARAEGARNGSGLARSRGAQIRSPS